MKPCISTAQYFPKPLENWSAFEKKLQDYIESAKQEGAELLLLPEYISLELYALADQSLLAQFEKINQIKNEYCHFFSKMANLYQIYLQPGTIPIKMENGLFRNRAYFFSPDGSIGFQDKIRLTKAEKEYEVIESGDTLQIFQTPFATVGIAICYDVEFPDYVTTLASKGVQLLLVPSCTADSQGYYRVHLSCRARALENQFFVVNSCLIGEFPESIVIDVNTGCAGVFTPVDGGFTQNGIQAMGNLDNPQRITTVLDFDLIQECRKHGTVANFMDLQKGLNF